MDLNKLNDALDVIESEIKKGMSSIHDKNNDELRQSIKDNCTLISRINDITEGELSMLDKSTELLKLLTDISNNKSYKLMPGLSEINECISYLIENNYNEILASLYYNLASIYDDMGKEIIKADANDLAEQYYILAIKTISELVESNLNLYYESYSLLLYETSIFLDRTKRKINFDIDYIKSAWLYVFERNDFELASCIAKNYTFLFAHQGETKKGQEIGWLLIKTHKAVVDNGLYYDLKEFVEDAQAQANSFDDKQESYHKNIAESYLYAAYFVEHSNKESNNYRNRQLAINYYWYCVFAKESAHSNYAQKAYNAALKVPFDKTCRKIVKDISKSRK